MKQHQAHRIEAITKIVCDYGDRHHDPRSFRDLKCQPNSQAVHEAVANERQGREDAYLWVMMRGVVCLVDMVHQEEFFETVEDQKPGNECKHRPGGIDPPLAGQLKDLRQNVKTHDAQKDAGGEAENEVQPVTEPECKQPTGAGREKCDQ